MKFAGTVNKNQLGFTLIDMMISVSIIGLMAVVAVPAFEEYRKKSQRAETYIYVDAIQKAHVLNRVENGYFTGNGRFEPEVIAGRNPNQKSQISFYKSNYQSSAQENYYSSLADVIPSGTYSYYNYYTMAGNFNDDGSLSYTSQPLSDDETYTYSSNKHDSSFLSYAGTAGDETVYCTLDIGFEGTGLNVGGEGFTVVYAGTHRSEGDCEMIVQTLVTSGDTFLRSPFMAMQLAHTECEGGEGNCEEEGGSGDSGEGESGDSKGDSGKDSGDSGKGASGKGDGGLIK